MARRKRVEQAFILGAGLGTRLRPLTDRLPKPLVPLFHRPLAAWTMDACRRAGIGRFAINTHHLPDAWGKFLEHERIQVDLFHEPLLLDTGGGLKNIAAWIGDRPLLVHNGDIFTTMPLEKLIAAHTAGDAPVTLALRSDGAEKRVGVDSTRSRVTDLRHTLGVDPGTHVFSGVYCCEPEFLDLLPANGPCSVIPAFVELAREGRLAAVVIDEGDWFDLGDRDAYLLAHRQLNLAPAVHPGAMVEQGCVIGNSVIGPDCVIEHGAEVRDSVLWPGSRVSAGANLEHCIVFSGQEVSGTHRDADL